MNKSHKIKLLSVFILSIFLLTWTIQIAVLQKEPLLDKFTQPFVSLFDDTIIYTFFANITVLGSKSWLIPFVICISICFLFLFRSIIPTAIFVSAIVLSHLLNKSIKLIVERERPSIEPTLDAVGFSFPSGHAMVSIVCYLLVAYFLTKKWQQDGVRHFIYVAAIILIALIGVSRYIIHVHYLTDVIVGYSLGYVIYVVFVRLYEKIA
ncbi:phosphatase PAP2 family protein [Pseudogracilibacillus sp. ICA-222130]|uniref:phosphatase PAP2 family protein n=1 Tax=Pseudogracilibacillus sp. ICA-222130 TaxID=3134655 RepID=UPI0030BA5A9D